MWKNQYGFNMQPMQDMTLTNPVNMCLKASHVVTSDIVIHSFDWKYVKMEVYI